MQLRPYQLAAAEGIGQAFERGFRSALLALPTGCGKTIVFAEVARREVARGGRVLILAHRGELLEQAIDKLRKSTGIVAGLEKADATADHDEDGFPYTVVVGSVQSMYREKRLERFHADDFSLIIVDECHHALATTYTAILDYFTGARLLGVTATPDRGDGRGLNAVFETIAYEYSILQAIREGWLCPIRAQTIPLKLELDGVTVNGDFQVGSLGDALSPYLGRIAQEMSSRIRDRKTVIFTPLIKTSLKLLPFLQAAGFNVREVNGESRDRADIIRWFDEAGPGTVLLNSMLLTEGWDCPSVDCISVLRATKVRALYAQMVGRGTRLCEGKRNLLLLDFLWHTSTHDLCRPASLLGLSDEEEESATEAVNKSGEEGVTLDDALIEGAETETERKRHDALAKKLADLAKRKGRLVDPLAYSRDAGGDIQAPADGGHSITMQQIDALEAVGIACPATSEEADAVLDLHRRRQEAGLASPKQIRFLSQRGFQKVAEWRFADAKRLIDRMIVCGWKIPRGIDPATYRP